MSKMFLRGYFKMDAHYINHQYNHAFECAVCHLDPRFDFMIKHELTK